MTRWLVALSLAVSVQIVQEATGDPEVDDRPYTSRYNARSALNSEGTCSNDNNFNYKGPAGSLIQDLHLKLQEAEAELTNPRNYPQHYALRDGEEFDFIVVGAGSAGSVIANRLTEVEGWKVLLTEAGADPPIVSEVPSMAVAMQGTEVDWQYETEEGEYCLGMVNNRCKWPRGKVLGGSSTINYMMYTRGHPKDFDGWAKSGNTGWSYEDVLPYFKKSENMTDPAVWATAEADIYHGRDGLLGLEAWPDSEDIKEAINVMSSGMKELGYPFNVDVNGKNTKGFTKMPGTLKDFRRCSTAKAFLTSAKDRQNLFVAKNTLVSKILIEDNKAFGIELITKVGEVLQVRANKEVIVSAGAINSPQLLMLSGIGPKAHLQDLKIPIVQDLPVGENLQDHPLLMAMALTTNLPVSTIPTSFEDTFKFLFKHENGLSRFGSFPYASFINTVPNNDHPDVEVLHQQIPKNSKEYITFLTDMFSFKDSIKEEYMKINEKAHTIIMFASMLRPYSRGRISLKSTDPYDHPKIVPGTFTDPRDVETYLRTYDFISRLVNTDAFRRVGGKFHELKVDGCKQHKFASAKYRECVMRHVTGTTYHFSGTCKMGPPGNPTTVVDPTLRVVGVQGLRVADASVMPNIVSAHINAAVIMIAEKAADLVKQYWQS